MKPTFRFSALGRVATILMASSLLVLNAHAETDKEIQERVVKQRELFKEGGSVDHSGHAMEPEKGVYRGVFFGYLPCNEEGCSGIKMTLSLNTRGSYTLVVQPARFRNRESFEKGRYVWDEANRMVTLTPYKDTDPVRKLRIKDDSILIHVNKDGNPYPGSEKPYYLERSDAADNREMHIH
jgi:NlpE N-terminal domain